MKAFCSFAAIAVLGLGSITNVKAGSVNAAFTPAAMSGNPSSTVPGGSYSYGYVTGDPGLSAPDLAGYTAFTNGPVGGTGNYDAAFFGNSNLKGFRLDAPAKVPAIIQNVSLSDQTVPTTGIYPIHRGEILMHGSVENGTYTAADIRFTAAISSAFDISATFRDLDTGSNTYAVYVNGVQQSLNSDYSGIAFLTAGQSVDFVVGIAGNLGSDSLGLNANIAAVPLPPSLLGGTGLLGSIFLGKKFRRRHA